MKNTSKIIKALLLVFVMVFVLISIGYRYLKDSIFKINSDVEATHPGSYAEGSYGGTGGDSGDS